MELDEIAKQLQQLTEKSNDITKYLVVRGNRHSKTIDIIKLKNNTDRGLTLSGKNGRIHIQPRAELIVEVDEELRFIIDRESKNGILSWSPVPSTQQDIHIYDLKVPK